ncbi:hypothetical protein [Streptomyces microflavus]|uniref:hypothetical protein n=2 Tax=Streptomyces microflavus TaxID=1919 RepID=UPI00324DE63F
MNVIRHRTAPTPFSCRWCGVVAGNHGRRYVRSQGMHAWGRPTNTQIIARMKARRAARKAVCRCPQDDYPMPFAPVFDPYACEADDCHGHTSESNPFGGGDGGLYLRSVTTTSAEVSRRCGTCGWTTSVWHIDDGSAEEELHRHTTRAHGGTP